MDDDPGGPRMIIPLIELLTPVIVINPGSTSIGALWLGSLVKMVEIDTPSAGKLLERRENWANCYNFF